MARVLVVDDDLHVLEVVTVFLQACGHQVLCAVDGEQAREVLGRELVDILVTDVRMPRLDGFGLVKHVRALDRPTPIVMMSGTWTDDERAKASVLGISRIYAKPLELAHLACIVDELAR